MILAPRSMASSTISATSRRGIRSVTITNELDAVPRRLEHGVLRERGGDRDDGPVDRAAVVRDGLRDRVEDLDAVDLAAETTRRDTADVWLPPP